MTEPFNGHTALLLRVAAVVVPLSLLVSAGAAFGGWRTAQDVADQQQRLNETRADVLCPLYGVFLQSDTPERRAALAGDELDRYTHAIEVIADGAATLGCPTTEPGG